MKLSWNAIAQVVALLIQIANQAATVVPDKYKGTVAGVVAALQGVSGVVAHFYNPNGTSARAAWSGEKA